LCPRLNLGSGKEKKRVKQSQPPSESGGQPSTEGGVNANDLRSALESVRNEEVPPGPEEKEQYFMSQVGMGEQLCAQGVYQFCPWIILS
jgi:import receptor subunit TOM20